ncbi:pyruvate kinase [Parvibaculum lavamentivorans DS-1]|uniref:Pyruvate kinase n=1 Tax=Parvibaculum lavamentivorans (strain DS-1 / DSM 13023 / NCIMB 13966) TaxID=402881 RepID=A7HUR1_PARL1|nr:pyruvate kinase [Parvibaculum lavamentivorans]ABS63644.1 pyruvate kinase [Parvibaculum lavamentivorans DS-1]
MIRRRNVKIIATLGPASDTPEMIRKLFDAGADVFRLNMSHLDHANLKRVHAAVRQVEEDCGRPIGILADLQGPKLRVGEMTGGSAMLEKGARFRFDMNKAPGDKTRAPLPHPEIFNAVSAGQTLLLDDGKIRVLVKAKAKDHIDTEVIIGGKLSNRKGVSLPDTLLPMAAMTEKDRRDIDMALELGVDWVALSFVQRPEDVAEARKIARGRAAVMAKIEKPQALGHLEEIIDIADAIMVARGDLGVELPLEQVPGWQKRLTRAARRSGKPVVVATQMLESMISSATPTRAEVSDVATAVFEGADAIMLSAESAAGQYPVEAVTMMDKVAQSVEGDPTYPGIIYAQRAEPEATGADAISAAAHSVADTLNAAAIVCWTNSGSTGLRAARERPLFPIIVLTPVPATARRLALVWGLHCVLTEDAKDLDDLSDRAGRIAFSEGFAQPGQRIVVTAGVPLGTPGATNMLRVSFVGRRDRD